MLFRQYGKGCTKIRSFLFDEVFEQNFATTLNFPCQVFRKIPTYPYFPGFVIFKHSLTLNTALLSETCMSLGDKA